MNKEQRMSALWRIRGELERLHGQWEPVTAREVCHELLSLVGVLLDEREEEEARDEHVETNGEPVRGPRPVDTGA